VAGGDGPRQLFQTVAGRGKARPLRLCAVAGCRLVAHLLSDERCRRAIDVAEAYADKRATRQQLDQAVEDTADALEGCRWDTCGAGARSYAVHAVIRSVQTASPNFADAAASEVAAAIGFSQLPPDAPFEPMHHEEVNRVHNAGCRAQLPAVRDILRNPFRPLPVIPAPLPGSVLSVAEAAYDERLATFDLDPLRLSVLSDALEEAGCTNAELLSHLRSPGPHVRGCWAVDLILGKS
jgi:hypothetical protein